MFAQDKGMQFFKGNWHDLIDTAKHQKKMIFVDVYTDWCAPCKYMAKHIFTEDRVGKKYNANFLNYQLDAEKGEGPELAKRFNIKAYPTFLFLNSSGYLVHKVVGERETEEFISIAEDALKESMNDSNIGNMEREFNEGNPDTTFLRNYISRLSSLQMDNTKVIDEYFKLIPDSQLKQANTILYIAQNISGINTFVMPYLLHSYNTLQGEAKEQLFNILYQKLMNGINGQLLAEKHTLEIQYIFDFFDRTGNLDTERQNRMDWYKLVYYDFVRDNPSLIKAGYQLVRGLMDISEDSIKREDDQRYKAIMQPFWDGKMDSTKIDDFEAERAIFIRAYTNEISNKLYQIAKRFAHLPATEQKPLKDALIWARRSSELMPDIQPFAILVMELKKRIDGGYSD